MALEGSKAWKWQGSLFFQRGRRGKFGAGSITENGKLGR
jgi:hypothetical protein